MWKRWNSYVLRVIRSMSQHVGNVFCSMTCLFLTLLQSTYISWKQYHGKWKSAAILYDIFSVRIMSLGDLWFLNDACLILNTDTNSQNSIQWRYKIPTPQKASFTWPYDGVQNCKAHFSKEQTLTIILHYSWNHSSGNSMNITRKYRVIHNNIIHKKWKRNC
jgi:hypothetical protein